MTGIIAIEPPGRAPGSGTGFQAQLRYPDPAVEILDPEFAKYRVFSASVEQLFSGMRWAEGPAWVGDGRCLLLSDIPNNRILRCDEATGLTSVFRQPSNCSNGLVRDRQGRLLACEHLTRRVTRTEYDGSVTVLADTFEGRRLNSPNDIVCRSDGSIWFKSPAGSSGRRAEHGPGRPRRPQRPLLLTRCFGGLKKNRLFMAASHSLCSLFVQTRGAA